MMSGEGIRELDISSPPQSFSAVPVYTNSVVLTDGSALPAAVPQWQLSRLLSLLGHTLTVPYPGAARTPSPMQKTPTWSWYPFLFEQNIFYMPAGGWPRSHC